MEPPITRAISPDESGVPSSAKKAVPLAMQALEVLLGRRLAVLRNGYLDTTVHHGEDPTGMERRQLMTQARDLGNEKDLPTVEQLVLAEK